ncbi:uncharacterized protein LOC105793385 [Gossypium raimondii]|uniref:uncharacterized protein LOC105793385 n=1 Tax=Gossypium raimondii TaxID=29730 RepID=UPI00063A8A1D|nr:uncharacterized protein LOC105793385 [Gossypium raimondii]
MARWQILLSEFDIVYVSQKAIKGSAIEDFLASRALEDYGPLDFDFPNEDLMYVVNTEEGLQENQSWKLNFDGASNALGNGIGAILVSPNGDNYPFSSKLDFDCTNNMAEYEACIMGIQVAIERKIKILEVYGDSTLVIYQLKWEWETRDPKLIRYRRLVLELIEDIEEVENDNRLWYQDILLYVKNCEYHDQATENDKRTLRRLTIDYILYGEILYKRGNDRVLLRCVDAGIYDGLMQAWNMGARRITLEIDSLVVVRLINGEIRGDSSNAILRDIWKLFAPGLVVKGISCSGSWQ